MDAIDDLFSPDQKVVVRTLDDGRLALFTCGKCAAAVADNGRPDHARWHAKAEPVQWCNCKPGTLKTPHRMGVESCEFTPAPPHLVCQCSAFDVAHPVGFDKCGRTGPWRKP